MFKRRKASVHDSGDSAKTFSGLQCDQHSGDPKSKCFRYRDLDAQKQEIRLLTLIPGGYDDALCCSMQHVSLNGRLSIGNKALMGRPRYETVSYCWGDDSEARCTPIHVDGEKLSVPKTSFDVLRRLRHKDRPRTVWIDAVCINQQNPDEKGQQVTLMGQIYSRSERTLIELGCLDDTTSQRAEAGIIALEREMRRSTDNFKTIKSIVPAEDGSGKVPRSIKPPKAVVHFAALEALLDSRWFSRVWVMQEAALAAVAVCMIGDRTIRTIPLVDILRACMWLRYHINFAPSDVIASRGYQVCTYLWDYADHDFGVYGARAKQPGAHIACALGLAKQLDCSWPEDRVFGTLGLMRCCRARRGLPTGLFPDYEKPLPIVYRDATLCAIHEDGVGEVFRYIKPLSREELESSIWPSWVPRWDRPWDVEEPHDFMSTFKPDGDLARTILTRPEPSGNPDILCVRGIRVDTVMQCSTELPRLYDIFPPILIRWTQDVIRMDAVRRINAALLSSDTEAGADPAHHTSFQPDLRCTLVAGRKDPLWQTPGTNDFRAMDQYVSYLFTRRDVPPDLEDLSPTATEDERRASQYDALFRKACQGRRFIVTSQGRIGIAPGLAEEGDVVVVLWGGGTPFVLRPRGDGMFLILGQCYVHGIMDGEAVREWKAKKETDEVFRLC